MTNPIVVPTLGDHNDVASHRGGGPQSESKQSAGVSRAAGHLGRSRKIDTTKPFENIWYPHQPLSANIL